LAELLKPDSRGQPRWAGAYNQHVIVHGLAWAVLFEEGGVLARTIHRLGIIRFIRRAKFWPCFFMIVIDFASARQLGWPLEL
jgi:hypothetical protein